MAAAHKTVANADDVDAFIAAIPNAEQRSDALTLREMMERVSGLPARTWGPSIVGFGSYHYKYDSGREGDMARISFSPRKGQTVVYLPDGFSGHTDALAKLGKVKIGKACLYIKHLSAIDTLALEDLLKASLKFIAKQYPE